MRFEYLPLIKMRIDEIEFQFGENRDSIRKRFSDKHEQQDYLFDLDPENTGFVIDQKRDVYKNINDSENYLFLNYTSDGILFEVEIHFCDEIKVGDFVFTFENTIDEVANELFTLSKNNQKSEREYAFFDLNIVIVNNEGMGGEGNLLSYFYCSSKMDHISKS